jgi:hypothetical protein
MEKCLKVLHSTVTFRYCVVDCPILQAVGKMLHRIFTHASWADFLLDDQCIIKELRTLLKNAFHLTDLYFLEIRKRLAFLNQEMNLMPTTCISCAWKL